jgi:hypothetical protein
MIFAVLLQVTAELTHDKPPKNTPPNERENQNQTSPLIKPLEYQMNTFTPTRYGSTIRRWPDPELSQAQGVKFKTGGYQYSYYLLTLPLPLFLFFEFTGIRCSCIFTLPAIFTKSSCY